MATAGRDFFFMIHCLRKKFRNMDALERSVQTPFWQKNREDFSFFIFLIR